MKVMKWSAIALAVSAGDVYKRQSYRPAIELVDHGQQQTTVEVVEATLVDIEQVQCPVSYTHLVLEIALRQLSGRSAWVLGNDLLEDTLGLVVVTQATLDVRQLVQRVGHLLAAGVAPVSYTHLDVYKRQGYIHTPPT